MTISKNSKNIILTIFYIVGGVFFYFYVVDVEPFYVIDYEKDYEIDVINCKINRGFVFNENYQIDFKYSEGFDSLQLVQYPPFKFKKEAFSDECFIIKENDTLILYMLYKK